MSAKLFTASTPTGSAGSHDAGGSKRPPWRWLIIAVAAAIVAVAVMIIFQRPAPTGTGGSTSPASAGGTSGVTASQPSAGGTPGTQFPSWLAGRTDIVVQADIAPGINLCASRSMGVASGQIAGIGTAFPRTIEGAVASAANYERFVNSLASVIDEERSAIDPKIAVGQLPDSWVAAQRDQVFHVDGAGRPLDSLGNVVPGVTFQADAWPQYGAYRVWWANAADAVSGLPGEVFVSWLMPHTYTDFGSGWAPVIYWRVTTYEMVWVDETWKVSAATFDPSMPAPFQSGDPDNVLNQTFAWRASIIGPGWCVPQDATEQPLPDAPLTKAR